jgi:hypothetical protein
MNTLLIKLVDGTEVIGSINNNSDGGVTITDPLQVNYYVRNPASAPIITLHRYMPMSDQKEYSFLQSHILSVANPKKGMIEYYRATLKDITNNLDLDLNNELMEKAAYATELTDNVSKEVAEALLEKVLKKPLIN